MVQIDIAYEGQLRTRAAHGPSSNELVTDAPTDNHGKGESFSPTDLVATATGACMMTIMGIVAREHDVDLVGSRVRVIKHMVADPKRRIAKLAIEFDLPSGVADDHRTRLENAAHSCPVVQSLDPRIELPTEFRWGTLEA